MNDRAITRVITPDQVPEILRARVVGPNQRTMLEAPAVPVPVASDIATERVPVVALPVLPALAPVSMPPLPRPRSVVYVTRSTAVALAIVAAMGSALLAGGVVHVLHERQDRPTARP